MQESLQPARFPTWGESTHPSRPDTNVASYKKSSGMPPARIKSTLPSVLLLLGLCSMSDFHFNNPSGSPV